MPMLCAAMPIRPLSRVDSAILSPWPSSPIRWSSLTCRSSKLSAQLSDAFCPSLLSTRATLNPGVSLATMKALMPFLPAAGSVTANRMVVWPMLALLMNCLDPLIT